MIKDMNAKQMLKMCLGKRRYRTLEYANQMADYYTKKYGKLQIPYYCGLCGCYHLTTHPQTLDNKK